MNLAHVQDEKQSFVMRGDPGLVAPPAFKVVTAGCSEKAEQHRWLPRQTGVGQITAASHVLLCQAHSGEERCSEAMPDGLRSSINDAQGI